MPKVAKGKRQRAFRPRSRFGCLTCKIRHVKCDEARPVCRRCASTQRVCDGYGNSSVNSSTLSHTLIISPKQSVGVEPCVRSKRSFNFFTQRTCHHLAGFFASPFWERHVPQTAHQEPTIWHMVVAIGAIDENQAVDTSEALTFALEQYRLAIKSLLSLSRVPDNGPRLDIYLMASILFTCFENIQGHHHAAGMHIIGGSKLIAEVGSHQHMDRKQQDIRGRHFNMGAYLNIEGFIPFFASLNDDVARMAYQSKSEEYQSFRSQSDNMKKALSFKSIEAAKSIFDYGRCLFVNERSFQANGQLKSENITTIQGRIAHLTGLLGRFSTGLDALVQRKTSNLTMRDQISVTVLRLHILYSQLTLQISTPASTPERQNDILLSRMRHMVEFGQNIVIYLSANLSPGATSFCLDMGYVIPLFTVASQCPDRSLRWEAIRILRSLPRQEGLWNSLLVAKAAERIMVIEDSLGLHLRGCVGKLTDSQLGVAPSVFEIDSNGGRLQYISPQGNNSVSSIVVEELFSW